jgi:NADH-quinone oxidoreductase subunit C
MSTTIQTRLDELLTNRTRQWTSFKGQDRLVVIAQDALATFKVLRDSLGFDMLIDVTAVDLLEYEGARHRFEVVYCLLNTDSGERLIVSLFLDEPDLEIDSVWSLWKAADWLERELYDMFGITCKGHPNMKRLLLPQEFSAFPLRKDYPMQGRGERHNFPVITRANS